MNRWQVLAALALLCASGGCHLKQLRRANEDLERENYQLEQRLDELTWQLEDSKAALQMCQNSLCATGSGGATLRSTSDAGPTSRPRRSPIFSNPSRQDTSPAPGGDTEAPRVELPEEELRSSGARRRPHEDVPRYTGPPVISPPDPQVPDGMLRRPAPHDAAAQEQEDRNGTESGRMRRCRRATIISRTLPTQ